MLERLSRPLAFLCLAVLCASASAAAPNASGLLFYLSADKGLTADVARGDAQPNFADKVRVLPAARAALMSRRRTTRC